MKPEVEAAVQEIVLGMPDAHVESKEDDDGGAYVQLEPVDLGDKYAPASTWIGFHITFPYPEADVYPHFIDAEVKFVGFDSAGNPHPAEYLPTSISRGHRSPGFDQPALQVSRRSNRRNAAHDSALNKLLRVLEFLRTR
jgi:hypothetical protein